MCRFFVASLLSLWGFVLCSVLPVMAQSSPPSVRTMDDSAIAVLVKMQQFLREQKSIYAQTQGTVDHINKAGALIKEPYRSEVWIDQPNRFRFSSVGKTAPRDFFFDGKTLTLYDTDKRLYATTSLPGTNADLFDSLPRYDVELPFASLFRIDAQKLSSSGIFEALDLGKETIADTVCRHYAYRQRDLDWQIWVPEEGLPLPIRFAAVNRALPLHPQYTADTRWEKKSQIDDAVFTFTPPTNARQITLREISGGNSVGKRKNILPTSKRPQT